MATYTASRSVLRSEAGFFQLRRGMQRGSDLQPSTSSQVDRAAYASGNAGRSSLACGPQAQCSFFGNLISQQSSYHSPKTYFLSCLQSQQRHFWGQRMFRRSLDLSRSTFKQRRDICMQSSSNKQKDALPSTSVETERASSAGAPQPLEVNGEKDKPGSTLEKAMWVFYAIYLAYLIFLPSGPGLAPGDPVWAMKSPAVKEVLDLSFNLFLILTGVNALGVHLLEAPVIHPVNEGLFNFVIAWAMMFGPLIIRDGRKVTLKTKELFWLGQLFLTNIFAIPYMALRLGRSTTSIEETMSSLNESTLPSTIARNVLSGQKVIGITGLAIGAFMVYWSFFGRAELGIGGVEERILHFKELVGTDRVWFAFLTDLVLFSVFQAWLMLAARGLKAGKVEGNGKPDLLAFIPFIGLGLYLIQGENEIKDS